MTSAPPTTPLVQKRGRVPDAPKKSKLAVSRVEMCQLIDVLDKMVVDEARTPVKTLPKGFYTARMNLYEESLQFEPELTSTPRPKRRRRNPSPDDIFA